MNELENLKNGVCPFTGGRYDCGRKPKEIPNMECGIMCEIAKQEGGEGK